MAIYLRPSQTGNLAGTLITSGTSRTLLLSHSLPVPNLSCSQILSENPSFYHPANLNQSRSATYIARPKRPYTFTQLVRLSDGSTYLHRTSSPAPIYTSEKDQRNSPRWNPSSARLRNSEADAAGRLRAFRARYGRGWDAADGQTVEVKQEAKEDELEGEKTLHGGTESETSIGHEGQHEPGDAEDNLMDLISGFKRNTGPRSTRPKEHKKKPGRKK